MTKTFHQQQKGKYEYDSISANLHSHTRLDYIDTLFSDEVIFARMAEQQQQRNQMKMDSNSRYHFHFDDTNRIKAKEEEEEEGKASETMEEKGNSIHKQRNSHQKDDSSSSTSSRNLLQNPKTVSDFCNNLNDIEDFLKGSMEASWPTYTLQFLTENESFVCSCSRPETFFFFTDSSSSGPPPTASEYLTLSCSALFSQNTTIEADSNSEGIRFKLTEDMNGNYFYQPQTVWWCEKGRAYCESFVFEDILTGEAVTQSTSAMTNFKLAECNAAGTFVGCDGTVTFDCQICEDGTSVSVVQQQRCHPDFILNITCNARYTGAFLYDYHLSSPFEIIPDPLEDDEVRELSCSSNGPFVDEWCSDLSIIEFQLNSLFRQSLPTYEILDEYTCACTMRNNDNITISSTVPVSGVECNIRYFVPQINQTRLGGEFMEFEQQGNHLVPTTMVFCAEHNVDSVDGSPSLGPFCVTLEFGFEQDDLSSCTFADGCEAGYCELCNDGLSLGHSCLPPALATCDQSYVGSFFLPWKDLRLAINECPPSAAPTSLPSPVPSDRPTDRPTIRPSMSPTRFGTDGTRDIPSDDDGNNGNNDGDTSSSAGGRTMTTATTTKLWMTLLSMEMVIFTLFF